MWNTFSQHRLCPPSPCHALTPAPLPRPIRRDIRSTNRKIAARRHHKRGPLPRKRQEHEQGKWLSTTSYFSSPTARSAAAAALAISDAQYNAFLAQSTPTPTAFKGRRNSGTGTGSGGGGKRFFSGGGYLKKSLPGRRVAVRGMSRPSRSASVGDGATLSIAKMVGAETTGGDGGGDAKNLAGVNNPLYAGGRAPFGGMTEKQRPRAESDPSARRVPRRASYPSPSSSKSVAKKDETGGIYLEPFQPVEMVMVDSGPAKAASRDARSDNPSCCSAADLPSGDGVSSREKNLLGQLKDPLPAAATAAGADGRATTSGSTPDTKHPQRARSVRSVSLNSFLGRWAGLASASPRGDGDDDGDRKGFSSVPDEARKIHEEAVPPPPRGRQRVTCRARRALGTRGNGASGVPRRSTASPISRDSSLSPKNGGSKSARWGLGLKFRPARVKPRSGGPTAAAPAPGPASPAISTAAAGPSSASRGPPNGDLVAAPAAATAPAGAGFAGVDGRSIGQRSRLNSGGEGEGGGGGAASAGDGSDKQPPLGRDVKTRREAMAAAAPRRSSHSRHRTWVAGSSYSSATAAVATEPAAVAALSPWST